jgi:signal transduction histidine kinase
MHSWSRLSLATKLPLMIALLLALVCGTMAAVTYGYVRTSATEVAADRLEHAAARVAELLNQSVRQRQRLLQGAADKTPAIEYLRQPSDVLHTALVSALTSYVGKDSRTAAVEVWDSEHRTVARTGWAFEPIPHAARRDWLQALPAGPRAVMAPFRRDGDRLTFGVVWPLRDGNQVVGHVVERRELTQSPQAGALLTGLIGAEAALLLGNAGDGIWSDMANVVPAPPVTRREPGVWRYAEADGRETLAFAVAINDTPWLLAASFPYASVVHPATRFLGTAIAAVILLSGAGAVVGWVVCRRITRPLGQVTNAALAIAASQVVPHVTTSREDEVGRLAQSFNAMADEVTQSRQRLEALVVDLDARVLARTTALQQANQELEAFSYSVSHDLRAPLRAIDGFSRILMEDHGAELSPDARRSLDVIVNRTRHMGQLIDDLLTFSRLGRHSLTRGPVDMTAIATASLDEARRTNGARLAETIVHALPAADGERGLIRQVFENLVQNAFKFSRTRTPAIVEIGHEAHDGVAVYYVRDNGVGFDMAYADKLFGVFQRLHRAEDFEGTGVGLAIVDRIIRRHGGRVWADGAVDRGATFYFTLPGETVST